MRQAARPLLAILSAEEREAVTDDPALPPDDDPAGP